MVFWSLKQRVELVPRFEIRECFCEQLDTGFAEGTATAPGPSTSILCVCVCVCAGVCVCVCLWILLGLLPEDSTPGWILESF